MDFLERRFALTANHTSVRIEVLAGLTTFLTMAYIIFVQPAVLSAAGVGSGALVTPPCPPTPPATGLMAAPGTLVTLGDLHARPVLVSVAALALTAIMMARRIPGALLWGILASTAIGLPLGIVRFEGFASAPPSLAPTFMQLDVRGVFAP